MKSYSGIWIVLAFGFICTTGLAQKVSSPIIDAHCHIRTTADETLLLTPEEYFAKNSAVNIQYLFGVTIVQKGDMKRTQLQNDSLFAMAKRDRRFIPVCSVHPEDGDAALTELDRIKSLGGRIIKLHPVTQHFSILDETVIRVTQKAGELNMVVLMDGYGFIIPNYLEHLWQLALFCPQTKFIIAHLGGTDFHKLAGLRTVQSVNPEVLNNVWYDLSAVVGIYAGSPYQPQFEWVIKNIGTNKVLFGSDHPAASLSDALKAFYQLNFTESEQEQILFKNAKALLNLE